jgi:hypothetical protein
MNKEKPVQRLSAKEFETIGRDFWNLYEMNYISKRRMFIYSFGKGIAQGFGIFIGGTIIVALLLYGLSFFNTIPGVQKIYNTLTDPTAVQQQKH